jgi:hypothetical protein
MSTTARKFLILLLAGAGLAAVPQMLAPSPAAPPAVSTMAPAAASCGPPPVVTRRVRPEDEGCSETPSPALARR